LATRMGGPREALLHAIIRKNYGCTHFILGRGHATPRTKNEEGNLFYYPKEAQEFVKKQSKELGIEIISFDELVYVENRNSYLHFNEINKEEDIIHSFSGSKLIEMVSKQDVIPDWFAFPETVNILKETHPPRNKQGFTVFFTGLSGSGKSTLANALMVRLQEIGRSVTLLDGDVVRTHLSSELGFSKEHRDLNIRRISYVASEITKARSVALIAAIAPYEAPRRFAREIIEQYGGFVQVYVCTPISVCDEQDSKGLYAKARSGILKGFTGIDDPYELPQNPEISIDTSFMKVNEAVQMIIDHLEKESYLKE